MQGFTHYLNGTSAFVGALEFVPATRPLIQLPPPPPEPEPEPVRGAAFDTLPLDPGGVTISNSTALGHPTRNQAFEAPLLCALLSCSLWVFS